MVHENSVNERQCRTMLTELHIEALLIDEELADQVCEAWFVGEIDDLTARVAWQQLIQLSLAVAAIIGISSDRHRQIWSRSNCRTSLKNGQSGD